jgi:hypothetical protein
MLEAVPKESLAAVVFRYAIPRADLETLRRMGIDLDGVTEMLALIRRDVAADNLAELVDGSFRSWNVDGPPYGEPTRFSDGTWPVCYTALEEVAAREEIVYHRGRSLFERADAARTAYYRLIEMDFNGTTVDLRPFARDWPALVDPDDYTFCNSLGREAVTLALSALLAPSVRYPGGTNVPVFRRETLHRPRQLSTAAFTVDPETGAVTVALAAVG